MNERVIKIANDANKSIGYTFQLEDAKQLHELMDKFAELIIKECANYASRNWEHGHLLAQDLKTHFGVE